MNNNAILYYHQSSPTVAYMVGEPTSFLLADSLRVNLPSNRTEEKIKAFSKLLNGWHYGDGVAPSKKMIETAVAWNSILVRFKFSNTDAFPGIKGEIMVTAYQDDHYIELLIEAAGFSLTHEQDGREVSSIERATAEEAYAELQRVVGEIWNTSVYSIQTISTANLTNSRAWPSKTQVMGPPLLSSLALMPPAPASVSMSGGIIQASGESLPFFLFSTAHSSRRVPA